MIQFDTSYAMLQEDIFDYQEKVTKAHELLHNKTGKGNDYLGWLDWPLKYSKEEVIKIKELAKKVQADADVFLVCGIGGSYLGARAAIEMIQGLYAKRKVEIIYIGNTFSSTYFMQVQEYIKDKSVYLNVISKSGTTTETAMAFRMLKQYIEKTYGKEEARKRIIATTDPSKGTLKELATKEGYETLTIPGDIGGRFSVTTAVGLFPIAVAGVDIDEIIRGTKDAYQAFSNPDLGANVAYQYAVARRVLDHQGKVAEMFVSYEPQMTMLAEWWKQLFGESEGKEGKGMLPTSANFSTDLHSLGQFIQDGRKCLFETLLLVEKPSLDQDFPSDTEDLDHMNYLSGKSLDYVNKKACEGTLMAHYDTGKVPNLILTIPDLSAYTFGYLVYFYFKAIAMTSYLIDINPFDQPGVEVYKKNMFQLLGKK